jgi:hypothetical protein
MRKKLKQAIFFYTEEGELCVMNYSSSGDCLRRDGVMPVSEFLEKSRGKTLEIVERGQGHKRHFACVVTDRAKLEDLAIAANIKILP